MSRGVSVCNVPGCPEIAATRGRCDTHAVAAWSGSTREERGRKSGWQRDRDKAKVMKRDRGICHWCGQPGADQADHVVSLSDGGADTLANLAPIHGSPCHATKTQAESTRARARNRGWQS